MHVQGYTQLQIMHSTQKINNVLGHNSALKGYTGPETTWANEMDFGKNYAWGAGSIAQPVDLQSNVLQLPPHNRVN